MTSRAWPVEHARAWLLRKAAEMVAKKRKSAAWLADAATDGTGVDVCGESAFRSLVAPYDAHIDADRAVAEVYAAAEPSASPDLRVALADLIAVATCRTDHRWEGNCPEAGRPDARDPSCQACQAIVRAEAALKIIPPDQQKLDLDLGALESAVRLDMDGARTAPAWCLINATERLGAIALSLSAEVRRLRARVAELEKAAKIETGAWRAEKEQG